ncbi:MAG: NAD(P)H-dependent oxidoreductase subunit E, partial [Actinomycetota bacterium]
MAAEPTTAEREAVDEVLGPPQSGWSGGERDANEGHVSRGGHDLREQRHLLLPALHALQSRAGWISEGGLTYVSQRLDVPPAEAYGVASFYAMFSTEPRPKTVVHVCDDIACRINGTDNVIAEVERAFGGDEDVMWVRSPCLGLCERAPAALVQRAGEAVTNVSVAPADSMDAFREARGRVVDVRPRSRAQMDRPLPPLRREGSRLLRRIDVVDPRSLDDYRAHGGYEALRRAVELGPDGVIRELKDSKLLGRGGAAFPAGVKWEAVAKQPVRPHYFVCNADESEPGTFKDRILMEDDPFAVIEALTIAGYATGSEKGYVYIRGEYPAATSNLENAIKQAYARGFLGHNVMGEGFAFDIELRRGAGAYIC